MCTCRDNPTRMEWEIKFKGNVAPGTVDNAQGLIFESFPRRIYGDALGIEIGDILFFLDDYKLTTVPISDAVLLNFTRSPAFDSNRSFEFQETANLLCADVCHSFCEIRRFCRRAKFCAPIFERRRHTANICSYSKC